MLSVAEIMTREPYTLTPAHTVRDAAEMMREHHIRHIPLLGDDNHIVGIVSQRDVLAASHSRLNLEQESPADQDPEAHITLADVMTSPVQTVSEQTDLAAVASRLRRQRIGCMPVTAAGKLIGVISDSDFLEVAMILMEQLEMLEPEEID